MGVAFAAAAAVDAESGGEGEEGGEGDKVGTIPSKWAIDLFLALLVRVANRTKDCSISLEDESDEGGPAALQLA